MCTREQVKLLSAARSGDAEGVLEAIEEGARVNAGWPALIGYASGRNRIVRVDERSRNHYTVNVVAQNCVRGQDRCPAAATP